MKPTNLNLAQVWKDIEDSLAPGLNFNPHDRAVYSFLFRHTHLEGKRKLQFSLAWMGHHLGISRTGARNALRRLVTHGVVQLITRSCHAQHIVRVNLPSEISAVQASKKAAARMAASVGQTIDIEKSDFLRFQVLRRSIHDREAGKCFYCLRKTTRAIRSLDHVVPQARLGGNSYRNLVSCCHDCNARKKERSAEELLRWLFRERILNSLELRGRFRALSALKQGKLVPIIVSTRPDGKRYLL
ncbi:MAG TPA: HNH endonuclease [Candidatus Acidoferrum sp.]|nr:HNH endonuclease [Candidatus Acidoferrum sp.]